MHAHTRFGLTRSHINKRKKHDNKGRKTNVQGCDMMSDAVPFANILWSFNRRCDPAVTSLFLYT